MVTRIIDGNNANRLMLLESEDGGELLTAIPSDGGATVSAGGQPIFSVIGPQNLCFLGDSLVYDIYYTYRRLTTWGVGTNGLRVALLGTAQAGTSGGAAGTFEYRAADKSFRWTATGDTAGPWTQAVIGFQRLESGSSGKWIKAVCYSLNSLPATDSSNAIVWASSTGYRSGTSNQRGTVARLLFECSLNAATVHHCGAGGSTTDEILEMCDWADRDGANRPGIDYISAGTNDLRGGRSVESACANALKIFNRRLAVGRKIIIRGLNAQLSSGSPVSAPVLANIIAYNKWLAAFAAANSSQVIYIDTWSMSVDPAKTDGSPLPGVLVDDIHEGNGLAWGVGGKPGLAQAVLSAAQAFGLRPAPWPVRGDTSICPTTKGWMSAPYSSAAVLDGITTSTGIPSGWEARCTPKTDAVVSVNMIDSAAPGNHSRRAEIQYSVTAGGQRVYMSMTETQAVLGLAPGQHYVGYADVEIVSCSAADTFNAQFPVWGDPTTPQVDIPATPQRVRVESVPVLIDGTNYILHKIEIYPAAGSSGVVRIGNVFVRPVPEPINF